MNISGTLSCKGRLSKLEVTAHHLSETQIQARYTLPLKGMESLVLNDLLGREFHFSYEGWKHCIACDRKINKTFNRGYCFPCVRRLARCDTCFVKPTGCHYEQGTCREPDWGERHCMQTHYIYLALTSDLKVGLTRATNIPGRWLDQGAVQAQPLLAVDTRQQAGYVEQLFIDLGVRDITNWRAMLSGSPPPVSLSEQGDELLERAAAGLDELRGRFGAGAIRTTPEAQPVVISYPYLKKAPFPLKSLNLDRATDFRAPLLGIKGQYLLFECGVLNVWRHNGYDVELQIN